ncbi:formate dehydrogenase beta subunit [Hyphobacterium marinum]|uniref:NADH-quinone oxidoreductase subunit NuoF n=1 Tax=Hyphobacterium marinum TaxID=3116574 RepID=A0ABU7LWW4_9PROT|nr:NADH-quinone oxidoreductase subunit NuoF [Hyphobacterium sp. Y6023]MEE2565690.1 NADH-quinone oxidoreductase subunit NuoF [Hyphobacterium sp. Y6023]
MNAIRVFVPSDSAARSVGADAVAEAISREADTRGANVAITRTGSRGLYWLEPLVEVEIAGERVGYGPVAPGDVADLFKVGFLTGGEHALCTGPVANIPFLEKQTRITFARCGVTDPLDLADYEAHGGLTGLKAAAELAPESIVEAVTASGLRGRGGAGFPTGIKWKTVLGAKAEQKYICCNADEGDSGTYADRMILESDPFGLIEGMIIAGMAVGATEGFVYIRSEYPQAISTMRAAIHAMEGKGLLGANILESGRDFHLTVRRGAGSYICGEESAMLDSLEGKRGMVRAKPPIPAIAGLFGQPTVVNNVLSLAAVPDILGQGPDAYAALGTGRSRGTQAFQLAGDIKRGGLVETAFGVTLRELIEEYGGGTRSGRKVRAVQVGGPLGAYIPASGLDVEMDYEALASAGAMLGHGGIVVFNDTVDMARQAEFAMEFCAEESCGKCTPCRVGAVRGAETVAKIRAGDNVEKNLKLLDDLCEVMVDGSLCAMGGLTPMPVRSAMQHFPEDFRRAETGAKP